MAGKGLKIEGCFHCVWVLLCKYYANFRPANKNTAFSEERCRALQSSSSLRALYEKICSNTNIVPPPNQTMHLDRKLTLGYHRYKSKSYIQCFPGSQLVDWLINHDQAKSRLTATALGQALIEAGYLETAIESPCFSQPTTNPPSFSDSPTNFYRPCAPDELSFELPPIRTPGEDRDGKIKRNEPAEPTWVQQIPQDGGTTTDSEAESHATPPILQTKGVPSSSSFYLDLDLEASTVHLVRPLNSKGSIDGLSPTNQDGPGDDGGKDVPPMLKSSDEHEIAPVSGWHNATQLREENGELEAYMVLNEAWKRHEHALVAQFLNKSGLSMSWKDVILSITNEVIDFIRPGKL